MTRGLERTRWDRGFGSRVARGLPTRLGSRRWLSEGSGLISDQRGAAWAAGKWRARRLFEAEDPQTRERRVDRKRTQTWGGSGERCASRSARQTVVPNDSPAHLQGLDLELRT